MIDFQMRSTNPLMKTILDRHVPVPRALITKRMRKEAERYIHRCGERKFGGSLTRCLSHKCKMKKCPSCGEVGCAYGYFHQAELCWWCSVVCSSCEHPIESYEYTGAQCYGCGDVRHKRCGIVCENCNNYFCPNPECEERERDFFTHCDSCNDVVCGDCVFIGGGFLSRVHICPVCSITYNHDV